MFLPAYSKDTDLNERVDAYTKLIDTHVVLLLLSCKGQLHFTMLGTYVTHLIEGSGKYQGNLLFCTF